MGENLTLFPCFILEPIQILWHLMPEKCIPRKGLKKNPIEGLETMNNFILSFFLINSLFAEVFFSDSCVPSCCTPTLSAYNYPMRYTPGCALDIWIDGSFLYWQPKQDNMEVGFFSESVGLHVHQKWSQMNFSFKPGFAFSIGTDFNHDNWDLLGSYTRYHSTHNKNVNNSSGSFTPNLTDLATIDLVTTSGIFNITSVKQTWDLDLDFFDIDLGRWSYQGELLTCRPYLGLRGGWLDQTLHIKVGSSLPATAFCHRTIRSWGIGPMAGFYSDWMVFRGIRIYGAGAFDILFTRYNNKTNDWVNGLGGGISSNQFIHTIRNHLDLDLGVRWGTYLNSPNWHIDLAMGYGFQIFFDQNMFRNLMLATSTATMGLGCSEPNGNLYIQGLTTTVRIDF